MFNHSVDRNSNIKQNDLILNVLSQNIFTPNIYQVMLPNGLDGLMTQISGAKLTVVHFYSWYIGYIGVRLTSQHDHTVVSNKHKHSLSPGTSESLLPESLDHVNKFLLRKNEQTV